MNTGAGVTAEVTVTDTLVFTADGELYTGSFSGLDPDAKYKVTISYDSGYYTISGGMSIAGLVEADAAKNE